MRGKGDRVLKEIKAGCRRQRGAGCFEHRRVTANFVLGRVDADVPDEPRLTTVWD